MVTVAFEDPHDRVLVTEHNVGAASEPSDQDFLFDPFRRPVRSADVHAGAIGFLGLCLVREGNITGVE